MSDNSELKPDDLTGLGDESVEMWRVWSDHSREITAALVNETERGAAVLARAYLEDLLDGALLKAATEDLSQRRNLARAVGRDLSSKIDTFARYVELPDAEKRQMHCIREIGNAFAHSPRNVSFDVWPIVKLMDELARLPFDSSKNDGPWKHEGKKTISMALLDCVTDIIDPSNFPVRKSG